VSESFYDGDYVDKKNAILSEEVGDVTDMPGDTEKLVAMNEEELNEYIENSDWTEGEKLLVRQIVKDNKRYYREKEESGIVNWVIDAFTINIAGAPTIVIVFLSLINGIIIFVLAIIIASYARDVLSLFPGVD